MAKTNTQTVQQPLSVEQLMELLAAQQQLEKEESTLLAAQRRAERRAKMEKSTPDIAGFFTDKIANSGVALGRFKAGAEAAKANFGDAYEIEKKRQLRHRAERILAASM